jgi:hypothetical protein
VATDSPMDADTQIRRSLRAGTPRAPSRARSTPIARTEDTRFAAHEARSPATHRAPWTSRRRPP